MELDKKIQFFFESPQICREVGDFSNLYLLRRDIYLCFGFDPNTGARVPFSVIWPGAMAILAGIDLLGKFYAGDDSSGKVGDRYRIFTEKYIDKDNSEILFQLRNALLHSFGLYSKSLKGYFILSQGHNEFIRVGINNR